MKAFLVNLLIVLAIGLCASNAYQWYREARLHARLEALGRELQEKGTEIRGLRETAAVHESEIRRLDEIRRTLESTLASNDTLIVRLEKESDALRHEVQTHQAAAAQVEQYREAFEKANESIRRQNDIITSQNQRMRELAEGRNEIAERFNQLAKDYEKLGADYTKVLGMYTNLVAQVEAANLRLRP